MNVPPQPAQSRPPRRLWIILGCLALVPLVIAVIVVADRTSPLNRAQAVAPIPSAASPTPDPWDAALATLHAQAAALIRRDEQGWLAAVDPAAAPTREVFQRVSRPWPLWTSASSAMTTASRPC